MWGVTAWFWTLVRFWPDEEAIELSESEGFDSLEIGVSEGELEPADLLWADGAVEALEGEGGLERMGERAGEEGME